MTTPRVTVLIPSYNHGRYIEETLGSVFRQTLRPQEVHIIDDSSTDDSLPAIERAFANAGSIRCSLKSRENRGISTTRNELAAAATTDFIAFLDSDDLYAPQRLERMLEGAPRGGLYFAFSGVDFLSELGREELDDWHEMYHTFLGQGMSLPTAGFTLLRTNAAISASNFVMSRSLFDAVGGFDDRIKILQDWDFAVRASRFIEPTFIAEPLLTYRVHSRNTSRIARGDISRELEFNVANLRDWLSEPTPNPLAPTPRNWPRFFRVFANQSKLLAGRALPEIPATPSDSTTAARETKAIRDLIAAMRFPESTQSLSRDELMMRCQQSWRDLS